MDMTQILDVAGYTAVAAVSIKGLVFTVVNWTQLPAVMSMAVDTVVTRADTVATHIGSLASHINLASAKLGF